MHRVSTLLTLLSLLAACADQPTVPPDITVQVMEPVVWAGSDWVLRSPGFATLGATPSITLDDSVVTATRVDDSTITVHVPDVGGTYWLEIRTGTQILSGSVEVAGYLGTRTTIPLGGWPLPLDPGSPVMVAGAGGAVAVVNVAAGTANRLPIPHDGSLVLSVGASFRPNAVVATAYDDSAHSSYRPRVWTLTASPMVLDSGLPGGGHQVAEMAAGTWLKAGHHHYWTVRGGVASAWVQLEESERTVFSPDRSIAVLTTDGGFVNAPVLETATGTVRYVLPLAPVGAAAFTPNGDSLLVHARDAARPSGESNRLLVLASSTGQVLADVLAPGYLSSLVLDPRGRWIYASLFGRPTVFVLDRQTLARVATVTAPGLCAAPPYTGCDFGRTGTGIDTLQRRLHILGALNWEFGAPNWWDVPSPIADFSLPPITQIPLTLQP